MIQKLIDKIQGISLYAKIIIFVGVGAGIALLAGATYLSLTSEETLAVKYLREQMAKTAATVFAEGVVLGFICDVFISRRSGR